MYKAGDWVEVRSQEEILDTLDEKGCLDGMPFMPEMLQYCGQRYRVAKRAHKSCDTVNYTGVVHIEDCIHLEMLRCDGSAHGGCDAACLLFWKTSWVKPVESSDSIHSSNDHGGLQNSGLDMEALHAATQTKNGESYVCQATELPKASEPLKWWDLSQYIEDYRSGNVGVWRLIRDPLYSDVA